jgi:YfiH family protein
MSELSWIAADWPAPAHVRAVSSVRNGGVSEGLYASLNLGSHVGDDPAAVTENRQRLKTALQLQAEPAWLNQVHGTHVIAAGPYQQAPTADASFTHEPLQPCVIMTADCLPVLFCDREGTCVAAAHAGWRGLVNGVLASTIAAMNLEPGRLLAWLGPAIEQDAFEVGAEVREQFLARDASTAVAFQPNARGRWQADLYGLARIELQRLGVQSVYGGGFSCFADQQRFFSYRRNQRTGRMGTIVWLDR